MAIDGAPVSSPAMAGTALPIDGHEVWERAGYLVRRSHRLHGRIWNTIVPRPLTSPQYGVLSAVERNPGIDQTRVAKAVSLDPASIAGIVRRLESAGLLVRQRDPQDSRRNELVLATDTSDRMGEMRTLVRRVWRVMFSPVPEEEKREFVEGLSCLVDYVPADHDAGALFRRLEQRRAATWTTVIGEVFTGPQFVTMHAIARWPNRNLTELGELAALDKSTLGEIVARLVDRRWIHREVDVNDGRVTRLVLTRDALRTVESLLPKLDEVNERLLSPLEEGRRPALIRNWVRVAYHGELR
jgi:DNA-binding MarR family transcriptional regulator